MLQRVIYGNGDTGGRFAHALDGRAGGCQRRCLLCISSLWHNGSMEYAFPAYLGCGLYLRGGINLLWRRQPPTPAIAGIRSPCKAMDRRVVWAIRNANSLS